MVIGHCRKTFFDEISRIAAGVEVEASDQLVDHGRVDAGLEGSISPGAFKSAVGGRQGLIDPAKCRKRFSQVIPEIDPLRGGENGFIQKCEVARMLATLVAIISQVIELCRAVAD